MIAQKNGERRVQSQRPWLPVRPAPSTSTGPPRRRRRGAARGVVLLLGQLRGPEQDGQVGEQDDVLHSVCFWLGHLI